MSEIDATNARYQIDVTVESRFIPEQSDAQANRWVFAYHVRLHNRGKVTARLLTRHWVITAGNAHTQEVHGEGVVGEFPVLQPGDSYEYASGAILETPVGCMQGSYQMLAEDGQAFDALIPAFRLAPPHLIH